MKISPVFIVALGVGAFFLFNMDEADNDEGAYIDLSGLTLTSAQRSRIVALLTAMGRLGLTSLQAKFMLAQALHESGLLTDVFNSNNVDNKNNWTGIRRNGSYVKYPNLDSFVEDWYGVIDRGAMPLEAKTVSDYAHRLKLNGYYEDPEYVYSNALNRYFNMLS